MNEADQSRVEAFIKRWAGSSGNKGANCQPFLLDLCFTPQSHVERLVRRVVMEPLREQWQTV